MVIYGSAGIVVALLFWLIVRDHPRSHPRCNPEELAVIERGVVTASEDHSKPLEAAPIRELAGSFSMWMNCLTQFTTNIGWIFLVSWLPRYLLQHHDVPVTERGWMASLIILVGWCGMLWGGVLTDRLASRIGLRWGRVLPISLSRFLAMAGFLLCLLDLPVWGAVACCALVAFGTDLGNPAIWAFSQDVGGRHVGSVLGWGNMFGNFGAVVGPILLIAVVGDTYQWNNAFLVCSGAFFISGLAALGIDPTTPVVKEEEESLHAAGMQSADD
jgi:nitrate/nitrite transporter NarK